MKTAAEIRADIPADRDSVEPVVKAVMGRPTIYDPDYCELIVELGKQGMSNAELAVAFDVTRETLNEWAKRYPDFSDAFTRAKLASLAWWEAKARGGLHMGSDFNASLYSKAMSGRFPAEPYRERVQVTGADDGPIEVASPRSRVADRLAALGGRTPPAGESGE